MKPTYLSSDSLLGAILGCQCLKRRVLAQKKCCAVVEGEARAIAVQPTARAKLDAIATGGQQRGQGLDRQQAGTMLHALSGAEALYGAACR